MTATSHTPGLTGTRVVLALLCCSLLTGATIVRNAFYRDPLTLWSDAILRSPGKARPHYNLGNALRDSGDPEGAIREWRRAVAIDPRYSRAYNQLGNVLLLSGSPAEAERYYILAVTSEPDNAEAHYNLALVSESLGKTGQAIEHYRQFIGRGNGQSEDALRHAASRLEVLRRP